MNLKLVVAMLAAGILLLLGSTAVVASLPSSASRAAARTHSKPLPNGWSVAASKVTTRTTDAPATTSSSAPSRTSDPPSTAFVLVTITYAVKRGDTVTSIRNWFDRHGYSAQFDANLQVIQSNTDLLVPGALISISNGVMTIHSPV